MGLAAGSLQSGAAVLSRQVWSLQLSLELQRPVQLSLELEAASKEQSHPNFASSSAVIAGLECEVSLQGLLGSSLRNSARVLGLFGPDECFERAMFSFLLQIPERPLCF